MSLASAPAAGEAMTPGAMTSEAMTCGWLTIDLAALVDNWRDLAARSAPAGCAGVVKGDAYGIGLEAATRALAAAGCTTFFTALVEEAIRARKVAPSAAVLVLNGFPPGRADVLLAHDLMPVLGCVEEVEEWAALGRTVGRPLAAALHVDTGMNRLGLTLEAARAVAARPDIMGAIDLKLVMSHLACADEPGHPMNARQRAAFEAARALFPGVPASLANSAATLALPDDRYDLTRPGIALYGGRAVNGGANPMRPVARLDGQIIMVREAAAGETVGYAGAETLQRPSRLAIVGIGYADGFPRAAGSADGSPGACGWRAGRRVPLVGRVSMDLVVYDVTDLDPADARRGDWIELFGPNVAIDEVAGFAGTIGYELLTQLGRRFTRHYVEAPS